MSQSNPQHSLAEAHCEACMGLSELIPANELPEWMALIHSSWQVTAENTAIERRIALKNFAKVMFLVNAIAHMADQEGHHPDVGFGYNYVTIQYTRHEAKGLTRNDFICAKKVDQLIPVQI